MILVSSDDSRFKWWVSFQVMGLSKRQTLTYVQGSRKILPLVMHAIRYTKKLSYSWIFLIWYQTPSGSLKALRYVDDNLYRGIIDYFSAPQNTKEDNAWRNV